MRSEEAAAIKITLDKLKPYRFKRGKGCIHCRDTGYAGRTGIYEVLAMSEKIRRLVSTQAGSLEIFKAAREEGMRTLKELVRTYDCLVSDTTRVMNRLKAI